MTNDAPRVSRMDAGGVVCNVWSEIHLSALDCASRTTHHSLARHTEISQTDDSFCGSERIGASVLKAHHGSTLRHMNTIRRPLKASDGRFTTLKNQPREPRRSQHGLIKHRRAGITPQRTASGCKIFMQSSTRVVNSGLRLWR